MSEETTTTKKKKPAKAKVIPFYHGAGNSLLCDHEIDGITQSLTPYARDFYRCSHFVCEGITKEQAENLARLLGGELIEWPTKK
jgi:hypothetical protein